TVIYDDGFNIRIVQLLHSAQALGERSTAVIRTYNYGDTRPIPLRRKWSFVKRAADRVQSWLGFSLTRCEAKVPSGHLFAAAVPLISPRENETAPGALEKNRPQLPINRSRLRFQTMHSRIQSQLGNEQRTIAGQILEARQVPP